MSNNRDAIPEQCSKHEVEANLPNTYIPKKKLFVSLLVLESLLLTFEVRFYGSHFVSKV